MVVPRKSPYISACGEGRQKGQGRLMARWAPEQALNAGWAPEQALNAGWAPERALQAGEVNLSRGQTQASVGRATSCVRLGLRGRCGECVWV
eukprot:351616-Chlamydomonas_euryale.AAC.1